MQIVFYYNYHHPISYLLWRWLLVIKMRESISICYRPVILPSYTTDEHDWQRINRLAKQHHIIITPNQIDQYSDDLLLRCALLAQQRHDIHEINEAFFMSIWHDQQSIDSADRLRQILLEADLPAAEYLQGLLNNQLLNQLTASTQTAQTLGFDQLPGCATETQQWRGLDIIEQWPITK